MIKRVEEKNGTYSWVMLHVGMHRNGVGNIIDNAWRQHDPEIQYISAPDIKEGFSTALALTKAS